MALYRMFRIRTSTAWNAATHVYARFFSKRMVLMDFETLEKNVIMTWEKWVRASWKSESPERRESRGRAKKQQLTEKPNKRISVHWVSFKLLKRFETFTPLRTTTPDGAFFYLYCTSR